MEAQPSGFLLQADKTRFFLQFNDRGRTCQNLYSSSGGGGGGSSGGGGSDEGKKKKKTAGRLPFGEKGVSVSEAEAYFPGTVSGLYREDIDPGGRFMPCLHGTSAI